MTNEYPIPKKYIKTLDINEKNIIKSEIKEKGVIKALRDLFIQIDCRRKTKKGFNFVQTIDYKYRLHHGYIKYIFDNYPACYTDGYMKELYQIHKQNLEYEKEHKPIIYK